MAQIPMLKLLGSQQVQQPQNGTQMMDTAATQGIQQGIHESNVNRVTNQIAQDAQNEVAKFQTGLMTPQDQQSVANVAMQRRFQDLAINAKQNWENAAMNGDQAGMDAASQQAKVYREAAEKAGIDLSGVGADRTLAQARAARDVFNAQQYGNFIVGGMDSGQMYNSSYQEALNAGMSRNGARDYARSKASDYQKKRVQGLMDELYTQGINPDNSINSYGIQLISAIRDEDADKANVALTAFGLPVNNYTFAKKEQAAQSAFQRALQQMGYGTDEQIKLLNAQTSAQGQLAQQQARLQDWIAGNQFSRMMQQYEKYGYPSSGNGKGSSSASNKEKDVKLTTAQQKAYNKIDIAMNKLRNELANPKKEEDTVATPEESDALAELNSAIQDAEKSGDFDQETIDEFWKMAWPLAVSYQRKYKYAPNFNQ